MYLPAKTNWWLPEAAPYPSLLHRLRQRVAQWQYAQQFDERTRQLGGFELVAAVLSHLAIKIEVEPADLAQLPTQGAFVAVANQPGGLLMRLAVLHALGQARPDLRLVLGERMAPLLARLAEYFIVAQNPAERDTPRLRQLLRQLHLGSPLAVFPMEAAPAERLPFAAATERLLATVRLPVVPVVLQCERPAARPWSARALSLLYPPGSLLGELASERGATVRVRLGSALQSQGLAGAGGTRLACVRARLAALEPTGAASLRALPTPPAVAALDYTLLEADLAALPAKRRLVRCRQWEVYVAKAPELPHILVELKRLRALAADGQDEPAAASAAPLAQQGYRYLVLYDRRARRLVGACRLGLGKRILRQWGRQGFGLHATCKLKRQLCPLLRQSLELSQAFIRAEYQGQALPPGLVWEGLAQYLHGRPHYRYVLGQVRFGPGALPVPQSQLLHFLGQPALAAEAAGYVRPRKLVRLRPVEAAVASAADANLDHEQVVQALLASPALGGMSVPPRLRPYFGQQARLLSVHLDPVGSDALYGAVLLDAAMLGNYTYRLAERAADH
jgi:hypothetical protein